MKLLKCCWIREELTTYQWIDMLWFNFIKSSKRYISSDKASSIITPPSVMRVGLFWEKSAEWNWKRITKQKLDEIISIIKIANISAVQIYWEYDLSYIKSQNLTVLQPIIIEQFFDNKNKIINDYIDFYIIDGKIPWSWESYEYENINNIDINKKFLVAWWVCKENIWLIYKIFSKNRYFCWVDSASWVEKLWNISESKVLEIIKHSKHV